MKDASGTSWKEELFEGKLLEGTVNPGDPSILVISTSAIRSLELLSDEFWDLYKSYFHHLMVQGDLCICLYSRTSCASDKMGAVTHDE
ncbi:hypothetical protein IFM89_038945 [Coptis chinensis]|uniref:Uncharacterized protein n=1 Tax=Coptis chinensis TaxID=261450 RepID=A0A835HJN1_9MAGN|nr:hypothetical protein IFM89_038945 [Coptis chinensis]